MQIVTVGLGALAVILLIAIYVDTHILKWRPRANLLGSHTAYELDRDV